MRTEFIFFAMASSVYASAMSSSWGNGWSANNTAIWYTTITTTAFTTYCPEATVLTHGGVEYTVTAATTLTITDCPCTVTKPMTKTLTPTTILYTSCSTTPTNAPPPPPNPNNSNNPAPPPNPTNNNNPVMTQTVTNQNGGEVTVTNQIATKTNQNGGVATGTGGGAVPSYSQVVGAAAERKALGWGGMALGMVGGIAFLL